MIFTTRVIVATIGIAVGYGFGAASTAQVQRHKTIAAETFALVDAKGELRSILTVTDSGPRLGFMKPGSDRPFLTIGENRAVGDGLVLTSRNGATLTIGSTADGGLAVQMNRAGQPTVTIASTSDGSAIGYALIDQRGRVHVPVMNVAK